VKVVLGVPEPGDAPPAESVVWREAVPQFAAATGEAVKTKAPKLASVANAKQSATANELPTREGRFTRDESLVIGLTIRNVRSPRSGVLGPIAAPARYVRTSRGGS
jgi:hypothetical protein